MVTAPVQKSVINDAGVPFTGHTEYLAAHRPAHPVMLLAAEFCAWRLRPHTGLRAVSDAITPAAGYHAADSRRGRAPALEASHGHAPCAGSIRMPVKAATWASKIAMAGSRRLWSAPGCGHAGGRTDPGGHGVRAAGAVNDDVVLAMYHDQGLPVLKHAGFGHAVNVTLGLPIIRIVRGPRHALDLAGYGRADAGRPHRRHPARRGVRCASASLIFARASGSASISCMTAACSIIVREIAPKPSRRCWRSAGRGGAHRAPDQVPHADAIEIDRDLAAQLRARWGAPRAFELHVVRCAGFRSRGAGAYARRPSARDRQSALQHFDAAAVSHRGRP